MEKAYQLEFLGEKSGSLFVNCCGCSKTEPLHSFGPAQKPHYLIHFILNGKGKFTIRDKEYILEAGYGFLIPPGELVFYQADEEDPWTYVWVGFYGALAESTVKAMGLSAGNPVFKSESSKELYEIVRDMMEHNTIGVANDLRRNGQLHLFLSTISEGVPLEEKSETDRADNYVKRAIEFIQGNYCDPIKVTDVAEYVCINRSYLYTLFKNETGMSPQQFLTHFRLSQAQQLLELADIPIESIALSCGYTDPLVFAKAFKQLKKMSPSAFRREMQKGESRKNKENLKQIEDFIGQKGKSKS